MIDDVKVAHHIHVEMTPDTHRLLAITIDGERFPWATTGGVSVEVKKDYYPGVTITIAAEKATIEHRI
jgi:hypothetical protein